LALAKSVIYLARVFRMLHLVDDYKDRELRVALSSSGVTICLPIDLRNCVSLYMFSYSSTYVPAYLPTYVSIDLCIICLFICLPVCLSPSIHTQI